MKYKIFISYSTGDNWIANDIRNELANLGIEVFLDNLGIGPGEDIEDKIQSNLSDCNELWVLVTPTTQTSKFNKEISNIKLGSVTRPYLWLEIGTVWCRKIPIVPLLVGISSTELNEDRDIPLILKKRKAIDRTNPSEYKKLLEKIEERAKPFISFKKRPERYKCHLPVLIDYSNNQPFNGKVASITEMSYDGSGCFIKTTSPFNVNQEIVIQCALKARIKHTYSGYGVQIT